MKSDSRGGGGGGRDRGNDHHMDRGGMGLPMNLPPGVTPQLLNSLGISEGPITNQVFVANVSPKQRLLVTAGSILDNVFG